MRIASVATILALILAAPSFADVTIKQTMNGKALGFSGETSGTTYIKGNKMRTDAVVGNRTQTTIFDLDAQKLYMFDSKKKQADVYEMATFAAEIAKTVDMSAGTMSFTAERSDQANRRPYCGRLRCRNLDAGRHGGQRGDDDERHVGRSGLDGGGRARRRRLRSFLQRRRREGLDFLRSARSAGPAGAGESDGRDVSANRCASAAFRTRTLEMKLSGSGPMAAMMARMGGANFTTVIDAVETAALSDDLFVPPADYKLEAK